MTRRRPGAAAGGPPRSPPQRSLEPAEIGSSLNLNVHFHTQALDGVFTEEPDGTLSFHALPPPTDAEVRDVLEEIACRLGPILRAHSRGDDSAPDALSEEDPTLATCLAPTGAPRADHLGIGPRSSSG